MTPERQYPLTWPFGWQRTRSPGPSQFKTEPGRATAGLLREIQRLGGTKIIISSNAQYRNDGMPYARQANIQDPGVAVYFTRKGKKVVFACDTYWNLHDNIHAIAKTIEALRAIERYGASDMLDRAFDGYTALPAPTTMGMSTSGTSTAKPKRHWREVLEFGNGPANEAEITRNYRILASKAHGDRGGDDATMSEINVARDEAMKEIQE